MIYKISCGKLAVVISLSLMKKQSCCGLSGYWGRCDIFSATSLLNVSDLWNFSSTVKMYYIQSILLFRRDYSAMVTIEFPSMSTSYHKSRRTPYKDLAFCSYLFDSLLIFKNSVPTEFRKILVCVPRLIITRFHAKELRERFC